MAGNPGPGPSNPNNNQQVPRSESENFMERFIRSFMEQGSRATTMAQRYELWRIHSETIHLRQELERAQKALDDSRRINWKYAEVALKIGDILADRAEGRTEESYVFRSKQATAQDILNRLQAFYDFALTKKNEERRDAERYRRSLQGQPNEMLHHQNCQPWPAHSSTYSYHYEFLQNAYGSNAGYNPYCPENGLYPGNVSGAPNQAQPRLMPSAAAGAPPAVPGIINPPSGLLNLARDNRNEERQGEVGGAEAGGNVRRQQVAPRRVMPETAPWQSKWMRLDDSVPAVVGQNFTYVPPVMMLPVANSDRVYRRLIFGEVVEEEEENQNEDEDSNQDDESEGQNAELEIENREREGNQENESGEENRSNDERGENNDGEGEGDEGVSGEGDN